MFKNFNFFNDFFGSDFERYFTPYNRLKFNFDEINENETPTGDIKITTGENENGTWEKKEWISPDGFTKMSSYTYLGKESKTFTDKKLLKSKIKDAVKNEDYETAAKLKKELDTLDSKTEKNED
jgi:hypothetical protein